MFSDPALANYRLTLRNGVLVYRKVNAEEATAGATVKVASKIRLLALAAGDLAGRDRSDSGFRNVVFITASYGLGETVVQGSVNPDEFYVFKPTLKEGYHPILQKRLGSKEFKPVYDVPVPQADRDWIVAGTLSISVVAIMKTTCGGGSSISLRSAFQAAVVSWWASSTM